MKIRNFCSSEKEKVSIEWKKISVKLFMQQRIIPRIHKECVQLLETDIQGDKWAKHTNRSFTHGQEKNDKMLSINSNAN